MSISLRITDSTQTIANNINVQLANHLNSLVFKRKSKLVKQIRDYIGMWVRSQPEMVDLGIGSGDLESLAGHFGIPHGTSKSVVEAIVRAVQNSTEIQLKKFDKRLKGGLIFRFQPSNLSNLLSLPQGHVAAEIADLHWLKWLLELGNTIIVINYHYSPEGGFGRSRNGIMREGGAWRVPPEYAGTIADNFITRAFSNKEKELTLLFSSLLRG